MTIQPITPVTPGIVQLAGDVGHVASTGMRRLAEWAATVRTVGQAVELLVDTPFIPAAFWPKYDSRDQDAARAARNVAVASATAAILYGQEIGLSELVSLSNVHVIKGKPGLYAETMVAILQSRGFEIGVEDLTDHRCVVWGRRPGSSAVERSDFSMDRARKAGYVASNEKYVKDPQSMLYARAVSILCRRIGAQHLRGIASVEELTDEQDPGQLPVARSRTVARKAFEAAPVVGQAPPVAAATHQGRPVQDVGLPPLPGEEPATAEAMSPAVRMVGKTGLADLARRFADLGIVDPAEGLALMSDLCSRPVDATRELTLVEARLVLDNLTADVVDQFRARLAEDRQAEQDAVRLAASLDEQAETVVVEDPPLPDPGDGADPWAGADQ